MRQSVLLAFRWSFLLLAAFLAPACTVAPPPGTPTPPRVDILVGDTRAVQYGSTATDILAHPAVRNKAPILFGSDWQGGPATRTSLPAVAFFEKSIPPRVLRRGGADYVVAAGCVPAACAQRRGLLLVRVDGELLFARIDEGGFSHYYASGFSLDTPANTHALVDAAWRATEPLR